MRQKTECPECGWSDLTWDMTMRGSDGIQDGRHKANEMRAGFFLGCDNCSATVQLASESQVLGLLNKAQYQEQGLLPEFPPRAPFGAGMPRYGLRWNGPSQPLAVPMGDGYWTPWHLAEAQRDELLGLLRESREDLAAWMNSYAAGDEETTSLIKRIDATLAKLGGGE